MAEKIEMSPEAREAQRAYHKKWRDTHKERIREKNRQYWEKQAAKQKESENGTTED